MKHTFIKCLAHAIVFVLFVEQPMFAQTPPATQSTATKTVPTPQVAPFKAEELEQIVAPIALYPDALLAQILMASTYPLEIVQAARWSKDHPDVKGDAVSKAVENETWDPAVKSLVAFPSVLTMMNEKVEWTQKLGDAFLAQQKEVMDAVQRLRKKAKDAGNLKSSSEQVVKTEPATATATATATAPATTQTIIIEPSNPEVVYVPTYDPMHVYGPWPYAAYPPYYYYPPGYVAGAAFFSFTAGVIIGGALWGNCNWGRGDVNINVNKYNNFNRNNNINNGNNSWKHNSDHRQGVGYRDSATQNKYGRGGSEQGARSRDEFRGRAEQGRDQISREGAGNQRDLSGRDVSSRDAGSASTRDVGGSSSNRDFGGSASSRDVGGSSSSRDLGGSQSRSSAGASSRDYGSSSSRSSSRSSDAFSGAGGGGSSARASSSRGGASRGGGGGGRRR